MFCIKRLFIGNIHSFTVYNAPAGNKEYTPISSRMHT